MKYTYTCKKISLNDSVKAYAEKKIGKLEKFFKEEPEASVTFSVEKKNRCVAEITLRGANGTLFRAVCEDPDGDMRGAIDEATAQIDGYAKAVELRTEGLEDKLRHMAEIKAYAKEQLSAIPDLVFVGRSDAPHILSVSLVGWPSQNIVNDLGSQGICISAGSACHQGKPSQAVAALHLPKKTAGSVVRLSFGPETTREDIDACVQALRRHHDTRMPML